MALADNDLLAYDLTNTQWENKTLATLGILSTASKLDDLDETDLADPGTDRIVFWDDSDTQFEFLTHDAADFLITTNTLTVVDSGIDHDATTNFVAVEHIDHTSITLSAGTGLTGGGDISANRSFALSHLGIESLVDPNADRIMFWDDSASKTDWLTAGSGMAIAATSLDLDINSLTVATIEAGDSVPFWDITATAANKKTTFANFEAALTHDNLIAGTIASHDTTATGANLTTLTDTSNADALHSHTAATNDVNILAYLGL